MSTTISYKHASLMRRIFAALLDGVLIGLFGFFPSVLVGAFLLLFPCFDPTTEGVPLALAGAILSFLALFFSEIFGFPVALTLAILFWGFNVYTYEHTPVFQLVLVSSLIGLTLSLIFSLSVSSIYHGLMESRPAKATLGKLIMGIFVSDLNGNKISFMRAMFRYLAKGLSTLTFGVGYVMALGQAGQTLHDKITGCIVLSKE